VTAEVALDNIHFINPGPAETGRGAEYSGRIDFSGARVQGNSPSSRGGLDAVSLKRYSGDDTSYPALGWGVDFSRWMWRHRVQAFHVQDASGTSATARK
jgi:hypothetical protein